MTLIIAQGRQKRVRSLGLLGRAVRWFVVFGVAVTIKAWWRNTVNTKDSISMQQQQHQLNRRRCFPRNDAKQKRPLIASKYGNEDPWQRYGYVTPTKKKSSTNHKPNELCDKWWDLDSSQRSLWKEDELIYNWFFQQSHDSSSGTYVELGAFDGIRESNTRFFDSCLDWEGLLVEANPLHRKILKWNRPDAHLLFMAPTCNDENNNQTVEFVARPFSNVGQKDATEAYQNDEDLSKIRHVPCGPLGPILKDLFLHIDFFSLDVEGAELLVLETIFDNDASANLQIDILLVESVNTFCREVCPKREAVRKLLKRQGYVLYENYIERSDLFVHPCVTTRPPFRTQKSGWWW